MGGTVRWDYQVSFKGEIERMAKALAFTKARQVAERARALCPKDTGTLARSIHVVPLERGALVRATGREASPIPYMAGSAQRARTQTEMKPIRLIIPRTKRELGDFTGRGRPGTYSARNAGPTELELMANLPKSTRRQAELSPIKFSGGHGAHYYAWAVEFGRGKGTRKANPFLLNALKGSG